MRISALFNAIFVAMLCIGLTAMVGCGDMPSKPSVAKKTKKKKAKPKKVDEDDTGTASNGPRQPPVAGKPIVNGYPVDSDGRTSAVAGRPVPSGSGGFENRGGGAAFNAGNLSQARLQMGNLTNETATNRVGLEIIDSLEVRPTLAIWLFDRTSSAGNQRREVISRLEKVLEGFEDMKRKEHKAFKDDSKGPRLLTVVAAFGKSCEILTPEPTDDKDAVIKALGGITEEAEGDEMTFTAIKKVVEEFVEYSTKKGRRIILTVVSDEAGDDSEKVDELVPLMEKWAIPTFVIGVPAPLGREGTMSGDVKEGGKPVRVGPESWAKETVAFRGISGRDLGIVDSGYGPFALSRLAKATDGTYLIVRSQGFGGGMGGGFNQNFGGQGFAAADAKTLAKYAPDYVSKADYEKLLSENKCRMALHNAAMLEPVDVSSNVNMQFSFVRMDEAALKRVCDNAQKSVARVEPKLRPVFAALGPGESDRAKLKGARWQAQYDLAMGQILAARARYEGYNTMVAQIKQGKRPGGPADNVWTMVMKNSFSSDSAMDKLVKNSRMYLKRVVDEHPGTPWAAMAAAEMNIDCGWEWMATAK